MKIIDAEQVAKLIPYHDLINALRDAFKAGGYIPLRHNHSIKTKAGTENTLLLMPCWQEGGMLGIKLVMVCPDNNKKNLDSVSSTYILSDADTGQNLAIMDGDELTARRTACASALASSYLSNPASEKMLMMGTGKIAAHLIYAHSAIRDLKEIYVWGRNYQNTKRFAETVSIGFEVPIIVIENPEEYAGSCDIISCATMADKPILKGKWLDTSKKQHIDLVGAFTPDMREADNDVIQNCDIYVDTYEGTIAEAGDIIHPLEEGIINRHDICGELSEMVADGFMPKNSTRSTLFKSVGTALEDLAAAKMVYLGASR